VVVRTPVLVKQSSFFPDGLLDEYIVYTYAEDKTTLLKEDKFDASRPDPIEKTSYQYSDGRLVAKTVLDADGKVKYRHSFEIDAAGRITKDSAFDAKNKLQSISAYSFDSDGNRASWVTLDGNGAVLAETTYAYDGGRLVKIDIKNPSGSETGSIGVSYDYSGLPVKRSYFAADGSLDKYDSYQYADGNLAVEASYLASGAPASRIQYAYDADGAMVKKLSMNSSGKIVDSSTYEYVIKQSTTTVEEGDNP
jgi:hypothetical protein